MPVRQIRKAESELPRQLQRARVRNHWNQQFIPDNVLRTLLSKESIQAYLQTSNDALVNFVYEKCWKIFAIFVFMFKKPEEVLNELETCHASGFGDERLPIDDPMLQKCCTDEGIHEHVEETSKHHNEEVEDVLDCYRRHPTGEGWDDVQLLDFYEMQWKVLALCLRKEQWIYELAPGQVLPTKKSGPHNISYQGHFSEVWELLLPAWHQDTFKRGAEDVRIALKMFKGIDQEEIRGNWKREIETLKALARVENAHPNIVRCLGGVVTSSQESTDKGYYAIFEWAPYKTLIDYWRERKEPAPTVDEADHFLRMFTGISGALRHLHQDQTMNTPPLESSDSGPAGDRPGPAVEIPVITVDRSEDPGDPGPLPKPRRVATSGNMRHGDIKPGNILVFEPWWAKLGDFGLAKAHTEITGRRDKATSEKHSTFVYEPPEACDDSAPRSRLFDVWSLGCTMLEGLIWILYGWEGLARWFAAHDKHSLCYYTLDKKSMAGASVSQNATRLMNSMRLNDPRCSQSSSTVFKDILDLVQRHMLVVGLPHSQFLGDKRIDSDRLCEEFEKMMGRAKADRSYLSPQLSSQNNPLDTVMGFLSSRQAQFSTDAGADRFVLSVRGHRTGNGRNKNGCPPDASYIDAC